MNKALMLVDFEKEWTDKKSPYYVGNISEVLKRTNKLIDFCREKGYKIIFTRHIEKDSESEFSGDNANVISSMHKKPRDTLITKYKISPFYRTNLERELKGINQIVICGILTNLCVRHLAEDAYDREFDITIIKDCCVALDKKTHDFTINDLKSTREEINFVNLKEFLN